jgi:hypothetical protein
MNKRKYWGIIFYNTVFSRETLPKQQVLERIQKTKLFCGLGLGHSNRNGGLPKPLGSKLIPRLVLAVRSILRLKQSIKIKMSFIEIGD